MKAILVIDKIPTNCGECPCCLKIERHLAWCQSKKARLTDEHIDKRLPTWCPLIPMPQYEAYRSDDSKSMKHYKQGINDTIAKLNGELMQNFCEEIEK